MDSGFNIFTLLPSQEWMQLLIITTVFTVGAVIIHLIFSRITKHITAEENQKKWAINYQNQELIAAHETTLMMLWAWRFICFVAYFFYFGIYLSSIFSVLPSLETYTTYILNFFLSPVEKVKNAIISYLPNLMFLSILFVATKIALRVVKHGFDGIKRERIKVNGFYPEWANPTYKIARGLIWIFFLVIAFPYLPGANSPAFKGVSIFLGVLLSLGSTNAVANIISGIVLTYMRSFHPGDRVRIADAEGDVIAKTLFVTRMRTIKNVDIYIPNAMVLSHHIINYSVQAKKKGVLLHAVITIGYDVHWTKIHELLTKAADMTSRLEKDPAPFVLQKALDDFYVHYEINAMTREPEKMALIYSELFGHIQTVFHEESIEIASPHLSALRDGNHVNIPDDYLPKNYKPLSFGIHPFNS